MSRVSLVHRNSVAVFPLERDIVSAHAAKPGTASVRI
jgi:hypothetical protein